MYPGVLDNAGELGCASVVPRPPRPCAAPLLKRRRKSSPCSRKQRSCRCGAGAAEGLEERADGVLDLQVGVEDDPAGGVIDQTRTQPHLQLAAARLRQLATEEASAQDVEFCFAHSPLEAEQQPVVEVGWVVDALNAIRYCLPFEGMRVLSAGVGAAEGS